MTWDEAWEEMPREETHTATCLRPEPHSSQFRLRELCY